MNLEKESDKKKKIEPPKPAESSDEGFFSGLGEALADIAVLDIVSDVASAAVEVVGEILSGIGDS